MTIRLEREVKQRLDHPPEATPPSKSHPATGAIRDFVDLDECQIQDIRSAVAEADSGDFASDDLVRDMLGKWGIAAG